MSYELGTENRGSVPEFESIRGFFLSIESSVEGLEDLQRVKTLTDGTEIIVNHYQSVEHGGSSKEFETFDVNVYKENYGGIIFVVTENGLVMVEVAKKRVTLRSHLFPRPGENLQVAYDKDDSAKTPLEAFRQAAKPLATWLNEIKATDQWISPTVAISEKSLS